MQLVVVMAVRKAVSAATITFTATVVDSTRAAVQVGVALILITVFASVLLFLVTCRM